MDFEKQTLILYMAFPIHIFDPFCCLLQLKLSHLRLLKILHTRDVFKILIMGISQSPITPSSSNMIPILLSLPDRGHQCYVNNAHMSLVSESFVGKM